MAQQHKVEIVYCTAWGYYPRATSLAAEIKKQYGVEPTLTKGSGGIFDVKVDGKMLFSKHSVGRFPEHDEVLDPLGEALKK